MKWQKVRLDSIAEIQSGGTPSRNNKEYWEKGNIPWIKISDIKNMFVKSSEEKITNRGLEKSSAKLFKKGTILYTIFATLGEVGILEIDAAANQAIAGISIQDEKVDRKYLYHYLKSQKRTIVKKGRGVAQNNINLTILKSYEVPIPPLETQKKIADVLDMAQELIDKRKKQIDLLDKFLQSLFLDMFGDPVSNPKGWDLKSIRVISKKLNDGPFGSNLKTEHYQSDGIRVIRLQNIGVGKFLDDDKVFISKEHYLTLAKYKCCEGDVLIGTLGNPNLRACLLPSSIGMCINKADCVRCTPNTEVVTPQYLSCLLNLPSVNKMASALFHGQTRSRISMGQIAGLNIPIPEIYIQNKFAEIVEAADKQRELMERSLALMELNLKGLMQRAFKGELFN